MTAPEGRLGVDIEYRSDRVNKIADKFIRKDEHADTTEERLTIWSAKETTYKYFSEQNLEYYDMKTEPFTATEKGFLEMRNLKSGGSICVNFVITSRYLLTFASEEMKK
jgi:4'-phosphopantetheinyl transferase EntD